MRVAYYAQVNPDPDTRATTHPDAPELLARQKFHLRDEIARHPDWELAGAYAEVGAGRTLERPALGELRRSASHGQLDLVLVTNLTRFGRRSEVAAAIVAELAAYGVQVQVLGDPEPLDGTRLAAHLGWWPRPATTPRRVLRARGGSLTAACGRQQ